MDYYTTQLGRDGRGRGVNRTPESAIKYTHDIFRRAAQEKLDVYMVCGSLCGELRDEIYTHFVRHSFADSVRETLEAGCNVAIFVWGDPAKDGISNSFQRLLRDTLEHKGSWGSLQVRASGTRDGGDDATHFIVAKSKSESRWIVRVEQPHPRFSNEQLLSLKFEVPAVLLFDSDEARPQGERLMTIFNELYDAVERRLNSRPSAAKAAAVPWPGAFPAETVDAVATTHGTKQTCRRGR